jgi:signal transduction histidine kinase
VNDSLALMDELGCEACAAAPVNALKEKFGRMKLDWLRTEVPRALLETTEGLSRVSHIVGAMKEFSHPSSDRKEAVDLRDAITTTITVARHEWKYVAEMETCFDPELPDVPCYRNELNQVILNLIVNAAHAIAERHGDEGAKGKIVITTERVGAEVEIRIQDDGAGIPQAIAERVFEPFFTTKPVGKGTGQGLAFAHSVVVDKHGGRMRFESTPGAGTCFFLRLPLGEEDAS